jgi:hypothetical protein
MPNFARALHRNSVLTVPRAFFLILSLLSLSAWASAQQNYTRPPAPRWSKPGSAYHTKSAVSSSTGSNASSAQRGGKPNNALPRSTVAPDSVAGSSRASSGRELDILEKASLQQHIGTSSAPAAASKPVILPQTHSAPINFNYRGPK